MERLEVGQLPPDINVRFGHRSTDAKDAWDSLDKVCRRGVASNTKRPDFLKDAAGPYQGLATRYPRETALLAQWYDDGLSGMQIKRAIAKDRTHAAQWDGLFGVLCNSLEKRADPSGYFGVNAMHTNQPKFTEADARHAFGMFNAPPAPAPPAPKPALPGQAAPKPAPTPASAVGAPWRNITPVSTVMESEPVRRFNNAATGGFYAVGGGLASIPAGLFRAGTSLAEQAGANPVYREMGQAAFNKTWPAVPAGLHDLAVQPFTGRSAVGEMTAANQREMRSQGYNTLATVAGMGDTVTRLAAPAATTGLLLKGAPGVRTAPAAPVAAEATATEAAIPTTAEAASTGVPSATAGVPNAVNAATAPLRWSARHPYINRAGTATKALGGATAAGAAFTAGGNAVDTRASANRYLADTIKNTPTNAPGLARFDELRAQILPTLHGMAQGKIPKTPENLQQVALDMHGLANAYYVAGGGKNWESSYQEWAQLVDKGDFAGAAQKLETLPAVVERTEQHLNAQTNPQSGAGAPVASAGAPAAGAGAPDPAQAQHNAITDIMAWLQNEKVPWYAKAAVFAGLPLSILGLGSAVFGGGGLSSILMSVLGVGSAAAGLGLFGGVPGPMNGVGGIDKLVGGWFGAGGNAGQPSPAQATQAQAPPAQAPPTQAPPAQAAPAMAQLPGDVNHDGVLQPEEMQAVLNDPKIRAQLVRLPLAQRADFLRHINDQNVRQQIKDMAWYYPWHQQRVEEAAAQSPLHLTPPEVKALVEAQGALG